jgi:hypothetical protein
MSIKKLYMNTYTGGLTNIKIKIVYAKIIAIKTNRTLIFIDMPMWSKIYKSNKFNISNYFILNNLGELVSDNDVSKLKKYSFRGWAGSDDTIDKIVNDINKLKSNDILLNGDMILSRKCVNELNDNIHLFNSIKTLNPIDVERWDITLHLRLESDQPWIKHFDINNCIKSILAKWSKYKINILCNFEELSIKYRSTLDLLKNNYQDLIFINRPNDETYELNAEKDFQTILKSIIFVAITKYSTFANLACKIRNKDSYIFENNKINQYNPKYIY